MAYSRFHALMTLDFAKGHEDKREVLNKELLLRKWHNLPMQTSSWFKVFKYDADLQKTEAEVREEAVEDIEVVKSKVKIPYLEVAIQVGAVELFRRKI